MIELNKQYSTKELADALEISYSWMRRNRAPLEEHLGKFYDFTKSKQGNATYYLFTESICPYISYKEYKKLLKNNIVQEQIKNTIEKDERQTGANIARIIYVEKEIQALDWELSTLSVYVRDQLRDLVERGCYWKTDYCWCVLDKNQNKYLLMEEPQIKLLRSYFHTGASQAEEEDILARRDEGDLSTAEAAQAVGEVRIKAFMNGRERYLDETGCWPLKVPVYVRCGFEGI